jgi:hypothetical protein
MWVFLFLSLSLSLSLSLDYGLLFRYFSKNTDALEKVGIKLILQDFFWFFFSRFPFPWLSLSVGILSLNLTLVDHFSQEKDRDTCCRSGSSASLFITKEILASHFDMRNVNDFSFWYAFLSRSLLHFVLKPKTSCVDWLFPDLLLTESLFQSELSRESVFCFLLDWLR